MRIVHQVWAALELSQRCRRRHEEAVIQKKQKFVVDALMNPLPKVDGDFLFLGAQ